MIQNPSVAGSGNVETVTITIDNSEYIPDDPAVWVDYVDSDNALKSVYRNSGEAELIITMPKNRLINAYQLVMGSTFPAVLSGGYQKVDDTVFFITGDCVVTPM